LSRRFCQPHIVCDELPEPIPNATGGGEVDCIETAQQEWLDVSRIFEQSIIQAKQK
jgi:hypothetical protein